MTLPKEMSVEQAKASLRAMRIVDVREPHEFVDALGHIEGAELIPLLKLIDPMYDLDKTTPTLLVCRSGRRGVQAIEALEKRGHHNLTNLTGGMMEWSRLGLPACRDAHGQDGRCNHAHDKEYA